MSQENVDVVRAIYEAWAEGRSAAPFIEKELEYVNPPDAVEPGTKYGRHYLVKVQEVFPDVRFEIERFIDAGDDVVVIAKILGRGSGSGIDAMSKQGYIWTVANGKATRFQWFNDPAQALAAVGLSEQDAQSS
jgi:ketosteroid isomerase-like protein